MSICSISLTNSLGEDIYRTCIIVLEFYSVIMLIYPPTHPGEKCAARGMASSITPADISVEITDRLSWSPHNVHTLCSHDVAPATLRNLRSLLLSLHMQKLRSRSSLRRL